MKLDYRKFNRFEFREEDGEGIFSGYAVTWDFVDAYRSMFRKGSFTKTLQERGDRIKVKYNHETLIGKVLEAREDDVGLFVRGKLNLSVQAAKDVYSFLRDGTLDGLSFAFRSIKDHYEKGVRVFSEVALYEFGPVDDPASDAAVITSVRDDRAVDFEETAQQMDIARAMYDALHALEYTLYDIWGEAESSEQVVSLIDEALSKFHATYLEAAQNYVSMFWTDGMRQVPRVEKSEDQNLLAISMRAWLEASQQTAEQIAASTVLTLDEVNQLQEGRVIATREKLVSLPENVRQAHRQVRFEHVEGLCALLREGLTPAEKLRINALLSRSPSEPSSDTRDDTQPDESAVFESLRALRARLLEDKCYA